MKEPADTDRTDAPPRQFFPDMDDQPRWKPQGESAFFADGRMQRPRVEGTVASARRVAGLPGTDSADAPWAGYLRQQRTDLLREDDATYLGKHEDGSWVGVTPVALTQSVLEWGQNRYNIYCSSCHGYNGDGQGMVGQKWSYPLPNFNAPQYARGGEKGQDGYIWWTALNGVYGPDGSQKMPGYKHALSERDAWAVVGYIRALQASQNGSIEDAPEAERQRLLRTRPAPTAAADPIGDRATASAATTPTRATEVDTPAPNAEGPTR